MPAVIARVRCWFEAFSIHTGYIWNSNNVTHYQPWRITPVRRGPIYYWLAHRGSIRRSDTNIGLFPPFCRKNYRLSILPLVIVRFVSVGDFRSSSQSSRFAEVSLACASRYSDRFLMVALALCFDSYGVASLFLKGGTSCFDQSAYPACC